MIGCLPTQALAFLAVFVYATQAIAFEWKPGLRNATDPFLSALVDVVEISGDVLVVVEDVFQVLHVIRVRTKRTQRTTLELVELADRSNIKVINISGAEEVEQWSEFPDLIYDTCWICANPVYPTSSPLPQIFDSYVQIPGPPLLTINNKNNHSRRQ